MAVGTSQKVITQNVLPLQKTNSFIIRLTMPISSFHYEHDV